MSNQETQKTISILGAGSMGTAIAFLIGTQKNWKVKLWGRDTKLLSEIKETRENKKYLPEIKLPEKVLATSDLKEALEGSNLIALTVPSFAVREMSKRLSVFKRNLPPLLMISKGMEKETCLFPFQIVEEILKTKEILHLTGVGYAKEIAKQNPVTEVLVSRQRELLRFKNLFQTRNIRIETSDDLLGAQLGGALKNVMVIGIGMAECLEQKPEIKAGLISAGVKEMIELGKAIGAKEETFEGPAGRGDLELSSSHSSRNYQLGRDIFLQGIKEVEKRLQQQRKTVEGLHTAWSAYKLAQKYDVGLPLVEGVYKVIYEKKNPKEIAEELMGLVKQTL